MKKIFAALFAAMFFFTGCTGSFNLTRKVYDAHRSQQDKWVDEGIFLLFVLLPVYGLSTLADAIVLNSIEFWTGDNPITASLDKGEIDETTVNSKGRADFQITTATGGTLSIERGADGMIARDSSGRIVMMASRQEDGRMQLYDGEMNLLRSFSKEAVRVAHSRYHLE